MIKGFKEYVSESGIHAKTWTGVFPSDIDEYVKKNKLFLYRNKKQPEIVYGVLNKGDKNAIFTYDKDDYVMYSDYAPLDFKLKRVRKLAST